MAGLSKSQQTELSRLIEKVHPLAFAVQEAIESFNSELADRKDGIEEAVRLYNEAVQDANEFRDVIHAQATDDYDSRSEKWRESEKGEAYSCWLEEWSNEFAEIEIEIPEPIDVPDLDVGDLLESLPNEPEMID